MTRDRDQVVIDRARAIRETDKALLVRLSSETPRVGQPPLVTTEEYWVPKSQILDDSEVFALGDEGTLVVTEWWAEKQGLA